MQLSSCEFFYWLNIAVSSAKKEQEAIEAAKNG